MADFERILEEVREAPAVAIDFETFGVSKDEAVDPRAARVLGLGIATSFENTHYLNFDFSLPSAMHARPALEKVGEALDDPEKTVIGHNVSFEWKFMGTYNMPRTATFFCSLHAAHMLNENEFLAIDRIVKRLYDYDMKKWGDVRHPDMIPGFGAPIDEYCMDDARWAYRLWEDFLPKLEEEDMLEAYWKIRMPMALIAAQMDLDGVKVDTDLLLKYEKEWEAKLLALEKQAREITGEDFNLASPKQVSTFLFKKWKMDIPEGTEITQHGVPSVKDNVIKQLKEKANKGTPEDKLLSVISEYAYYSKQLGTYARSFLAKARKGGGRVRASWKPCRAETGRWRCSEPNLMNLPRDGKIKKAMIVPDGFLWLSADLSQIELRVVAHMCQDPTMLHVYANDLDIHQETADSIGIQRTDAKPVNFGLIYGMGIQSLRVKIWEFTGRMPSREEANRIRNRWFYKYMSVLDFHDSVRETLAVQDYLVLITGRRRHKPKFYNDEEGLFRELMNAIIQGSAVDICNIAMRDVDREIKIRGAEDPVWSKCRFLTQVHDEINMEVPMPIAEEMACIVQDKMENSVQLNGLPIRADVGLGLTWKEAKG